MSVVRNLSFGEALEALKEGKALSRSGWAGLFIFKQVDNNIRIEAVYKMRSIPERIKVKIIKNGEDLNYTNQFCIVDSMNTIEGWSPSPEDICATDWVAED